MKITELPFVYGRVEDVSEEVVEAAKALISREYELCDCFYGDILSVECSKDGWQAVSTVGCDFHVDNVYEENGVTAFLCLESAPGGHIFEVDDGKSPPKSLILKAGNVFLFDSTKLHRLKEDAEGGASFLGLLVDVPDRNERGAIPDLNFWREIAANKDSFGVNPILGERVND